jgi:hypothetical protein
MQTLCDYYHLNHIHTEPGQAYDRATDRGIRCACGNFAHPDSQSDSRCPYCHIEAMKAEDTSGWHDDDLVDWAREIRYWEACVAYENTQDAVDWAMVLLRRAAWLGVTA